MRSKSVFALAAILALGSLSLTTEAHFAIGHGPGARIVTEHRHDAHVAPGFHGRAFVAGGHRRHFWHGRWWYYGVGPCWVWSDYYGEYVWACD